MTSISPPRVVCGSADASTRLGALQRGRGDGFLSAMAAGRAAHDDVLEAILTTILWDRQLETRGWYFGWLVSLIGLDTAPIETHLLAKSSGETSEYLDLKVPLETMVNAAIRGHGAAASFVRRQLCSGQLGGMLLYALWSDLAQDELKERLVALEVIERLLDQLEQEDQAALVEETEAPWDKWAAASVSIRRHLATVGRPLAEVPETASVASRAEDGLEGRPSEELVELVGSIGNGFGEAYALLRDRSDDTTTRAIRAALAEGRHPRPLRLWELAGLRGDDELLPLAIASLEEAAASPCDEYSPERRRLLWADRFFWHYHHDELAKLARRWLEGPYVLMVTARRIMRTHAEEQDRLALEQAALAALDDDLMLIDLCGALGHIGNPASYGTLTTIYRESPYSYNRWDALRAMGSIEPHPDLGLVAESLWDCVKVNRSQAMVLIRGSSPRIREMAEDPYEAPDIRDEALQHLASSPPDATAEHC